MSEANQFQHQMIDPLEANLVISEDDTTTTEVDLFGARAVGIHVPAGLASTQLSFLGSYDGENYGPIYDPDGTPHKITISSSERYYWLIANVFVPWRKIKVVCNATETDDAVFKIIPYSV